jgi:hypothetical protein
MSKIDDMAEGRKMIDSLMKEAQSKSSTLDFDDKLKLLDRWMKFQDLITRRKSGGMGSGFDDLGPVEEPDL